jgi:hypothetical protein
MRERLGKIQARNLSPGILLGRVSGIIARNDPKTNNPFEGLRGLFLFLPANGEREMEGPQLFVADKIHIPLATKFREAQRQEGSSELDFAYRIELEKEGSTELKYTPLMEFQGRYPLDALLKFVRTPKAVSGRK